MKLRISTPGNIREARIENAETGERLEGVVSFTVSCDEESYCTIATITLRNVALESTIAGNNVNASVLSPAA